MWKKNIINLLSNIKINFYLVLFHVFIFIFIKFSFVISFLSLSFLINHILINFYLVQSLGNKLINIKNIYYFCYLLFN